MGEFVPGDMLDGDKLGRPVRLGDFELFRVGEVMGTIVAGDTVLAGTFEIGGAIGVIVSVGEVEMTSTGTVVAVAGDGSLVVGKDVVGGMVTGAFGNDVGTPEVGATDDGAEVVGLVMGGSENGVFDDGARVPAKIGTLAGEYDEG